jgi:putative hemolysin
VIGFVRPTDVLERMLSAEPLDLRSLASPPLFVPGSTSLMRLLEEFRRSHLPVALVIDEHGGVDGIVSMSDVVAAIVGELPPEPGEDPLVVEREDGSWLVDGRLSIDALERTLGARVVEDEDSGMYHTVGGLAMSALERVPKTGDTFRIHGFRFEIVDMDGNRVDRVLVSRT